MKTIGVLGAQGRIGTTTQALQITGCLKEFGYDAAYMEMGNQKYVDELNNVYKIWNREKVPWYVMIF